MRVTVFIPGIQHEADSQDPILIKDCSIPIDPVPVYIDFDRSLPPLGFAKLTKDENGVIYADLDTYNLKGFYPAIGGVYKDAGIDVKVLGVCEHPNADERIKPIS